MSPYRRIIPILSLVLAMSITGLASAHPAAFTPSATSLAPAAQAGAPTCGGALLTDADATVRKNSLLPLGRETTLRVMRNSLTSDVSEVLIHFPALSSIAPPGTAIQSAELVLTQSTVPPVPSFVLGSSGAASRWAETSVDWGTKPAAVGRPTTKFYAVRLGRVGEVRIDVTPLVRLWASGQFAERTVIVSPGSGDMDVSFFSREGARTEFEPHLVIRCTPIQRAVPADAALMDARQVRDLDKLKLASRIAPWIQLDKGAVRMAHLDLPIPAAAGATGAERARWFLSTYADALRLREPATQMQLARRTRDGQHVFFRQIHEGIPVHPAELGVHMDRGRIWLVGGGYVPDITADPKPKLTAEQAEKIVLELNPKGAIGSPSRLRFLNTGLTGGPDKETYLTWLVNIRDGNAYFVDATSGQVRLVRPAAVSSFDLDLEDANNAAWSTSCGEWDDTEWDEFACNEGGCTAEGWADPETSATWYNIRDVYTWWLYSPLGRDSFDGAGAEIVIYLHVANDDGTQWNNAHYIYDGDCFEFGEGSAFSQDIVGHEFTHAVTRHTSNLEYQNESGAINESFSDVFGELTEGDHPNWLMGIPPDGVVRDLRHPAAHAQPETYGGTNWHPLSTDPNGDNDFGGVHTNSGVPNRAAYLLIDGNGPSASDPDPVLGIGAVKGALLLQAVQWGLLWSDANMDDLRNSAVAQAAFWHMAGAFTATDLCTVRNAYFAVGLGDGDADCDGVENSPDTDADNDYAPDTTDNCPFVSNSLQYDDDGDGLGDACDDDIDGDTILNDHPDNCKYVSNANQADWNSDGVGDMCDDSDGDAVIDYYDNCRDVANNDQADNEGDGAGDVCDPDDDNDGDLDTADNCPLEPNDDQAETDGDIWGDACDLCQGTNSNDNGDADEDGFGNPCDPDDDNDGVLDGSDNCPYTANPNQLDLDSDGEGYACDQEERNFIWGLKYSVKYKPALGGFEITTPEHCTMCGAMGQIGANYWNEAKITYGAPFYAKIVDSDGWVVASSKSTFRTALTQVLRFQPAPFTFESRIGATAASAAAIPPSGTGYTLRIYPSTLVDQQTAHELTVEFAEGEGPRLYLPLMLK